MDTNIFHEKQEPGSMLCAQHALNNLLQTPLYSASELAGIAQELDALEAEQLDPTEALDERLQNADDSGFFSVAVIERALEAVNLRLARWDSADMRPFHSNPEDFSAFILNFDKHWFVMRRFANSPELFYNLNSFLPEPERITRLYLGLQLHQAKRDNYSVFVILPDDESMVAGRTPQDCLPHCAADDFFLANQHLAFSNFGIKGAHAASAKNNSKPGNSKTKSAMSPAESSSSSNSRPRSLSFDASGDEGRHNKRVKRTEVDRPVSAIDEEEMLRRAIEASMAESKPEVGTAQSTSKAGTSRVSAKKPHPNVPASSERIISSATNGKGKGKQSNAVTVLDSSSDDETYQEAESTESTQLSKALQASTIESSKKSEETPKDGGDDFEEDAPTIADLRAKRLARFGG